MELGRSPALGPAVTVTPVARCLPGDRAGVPFELAGDLPLRQAPVPPGVNPASFAMGQVVVADRYEHSPWVMNRAGLPSSGPPQSAWLVPTGDLKVKPVTSIVVVVVVQSDRDTVNHPVYKPPQGGMGSSGHIRFPGFPAPDPSPVFVLVPGGTLWLDLRAEDLVRIRGQADILDEGIEVFLAVLDRSGSKNADRLISRMAENVPTMRLPTGCPDWADVDLREATHQLGVFGHHPRDLHYTSLRLAQEDWVLRIQEPVFALFLYPESNDSLIHARTRGQVELQISRQQGVTDDAPFLGSPRDELLIKRGTAQAYEIRQGELIQVIDLEGKQCSDFMAMHARALERGQEWHIDSTVTRSLVGCAWPVPGLFDKFFDQQMNPLLAVEQDTVGRHDTFAVACTARGYENRGFLGHVNCSDNISSVYQPYGVAPRKAWPAINFFFNSWIMPSDNRIRSDEAWSRAGDFVAMRALTDLVCVSTACPNDVDPINGWNPTDILVRIYPAGTVARRAKAYRPETHLKPVLTRESPFHSRTRLLTSQFEVARDLWSPRCFDATGAIEEYWACREAATVQDLSGLRKLDITGPDAEALLQLALTRDIRRLSVNRGLYALLCDERGAVIDDGTLFRLAPDVFRWCCSLDDSALQLRQLAGESNLSVWITDVSHSLCNLAVQGPRSQEVLAPLILTQGQQPSFERLRWFGFTIGRFRSREGPAVMVTRTGFTGEKGYEVFCDVASAPVVWDAILQSDADIGLKPMGTEALHMLRVEAGLMGAGAEFGGPETPDECGLAFAVDTGKNRFVGQESILRNLQAPRRKLVGLLTRTSEANSPGDPVFIGRRQVGHITSAACSPERGQSIAMARVMVEALSSDHELEIGRLDGFMKRIPVRVTTLPFRDPERERPRT